MNLGFNIFKTLKIQLPMTYSHFNVKIENINRKVLICIEIQKATSGEFIPSSAFIWL